VLALICLIRRDSRWAGGCRSRYCCSASPATSCTAWSLSAASIRSRQRRLLGPRKENATASSASPAGSARVQAAGRLALRVSRGGRGQPGWLGSLMRQSVWGTGRTRGRPRRQPAAGAVHGGVSAGLRGSDEQGRVVAPDAAQRTARWHGAEPEENRPPWLGEQEEIDGASARIGAGPCSRCAGASSRRSHAATTTGGALAPLPRRRPAARPRGDERVHWVSWSSLRGCPQVGGGRR
jgi:hypothetical protein